MTLSAGTKQASQSGGREPRFQSRQAGDRFRYVVSTDGQRSLVNAGLRQELSPIALVTDWTDELEKMK